MIIENAVSYIGGSEGRHVPINILTGNKTGSIPTTVRLTKLRYPIHGCLPIHLCQIAVFYNQIIRFKIYITNTLLIILFRPLIHGGKLSHKVLQPSHRPVQKKIVVYHNFFRSKVQPPASDMLSMVS